MVLVMRTMPWLIAALLLTACSADDEPIGGDELVRVARVLDGDSLVTESRGREVEVRLLGINTPERNECFADEALAAARALVGDSVRLEGSEEDRFGRLLGYVYNSAGLLVNLELVASGYALALSTDHPFETEFKEAETDAFRARRRRWEPEACGPPSAGTVAISALEPNAPGDDTQNQNGEWIEVTNEGAARIDLGGWRIQDESSQHRFVFPSGFELEPGNAVRVLSGDGQDGSSALYWNATDPVWSNDGDTAYLLDEAGNVRDRLTF